VGNGHACGYEAEGNASACGDEAEGNASDCGDGAVLRCCYYYYFHVYGPLVALFDSYGMAVVRSKLQTSTTSKKI
jgi:hypothetical protein